MSRLLFLTLFVSSAQKCLFFEEPTKDRALKFTGTIVIIDAPNWLGKPDSPQTEDIENYSEHRTRLHFEDTR